MGDSYKHFQGFVYASKHTRVGDTKKIQDLGIQTHVRLLDTNTHIQDLEVQKHILGLEDTNTCTQDSGIQTYISKN